MISVKLPEGGEVKFSETWPQRRIEWMLASASLGCGLVYGFSSTMKHLPTYTLQLSLMPQWAWAVWMVALGVIRLVFLYVNGTYRRSPHFRAIGAALGCFAWLTQFVSVAVGVVIGPTIVIWPLFFVFDVHVALTAAGEAGRLDGKALKEAAGDDGREP